MKHAFLGVLEIAEKAGMQVDICQALTLNHEPTPAPTTLSPSKAQCIAPEWRTGSAADSQHPVGSPKHHQ